MNDFLIKAAVKQISPYLSKIGNSIEEMRQGYQADNLKLVIANKRDREGNLIRDKKGECIPYLAYMDFPTVDIRKIVEKEPEMIQKAQVVELIKKALSTSFHYVSERDSEGNIIKDENGRPKAMIKDIDGLVEMITKSK